MTSSFHMCYQKPGFQNINKPYSFAKKRKELIFLAETNQKKEKGNFSAKADVFSQLRKKRAKTFFLKCCRSKK